MANEIVVVVKEDNEVNLDPLATTLDRIGETARRSSEKTTQGFERARDSLGRFVKQGEEARKKQEEYTRSLNPLQRLFAHLDTLGQGFTSKLIKGLSGAAETAYNFGKRISEAGFQLAVSEASGTAASSGINLVVQTLVAAATIAPIAAGAFIALAPALYVAAGAAGAASTALAGVGFTLGALAIGFGGIGDALSAHSKMMTGAGRAAQNTAEQEHQAMIRIRDASRALRDAKEAEADAARDVAKAIADEIERRQDLKIQIGTTKAAQEQAYADLREAQENYRRVMESGSEFEKLQAKARLDAAQAEYDAQTEKLDDLQKEKEKADKTSVEGSDQVQEALRRQTRAHEGVLRAQENLTEAQRKQTQATQGGTAATNAFDQAMAKLSPNAQKLVRALLAISDRYDRLKKQVQDRLLEGFDVEVTRLADKALPHLETILGGVADHLNLFGKDVMHALGDDTFLKNMDEAGRTTEGVIDDLSHATTGAVDSFGRLAGASGPVLRTISGFIDRIFTGFDRWIKSADNSGKLDTFMEKAADTLQRIFDIGVKVFRIVGQVIAIIFPSSEKAANSVFDSVEEALDKVSEWLSDPKNQKQIEYFVETVTDFLSWLVKTGIPYALKFGKIITDWAVTSAAAGRSITRLGHTIKNAFKEAWDYVVNHSTKVFNWLSDSAHKVGRNLGNMWHYLRDGFRSAFNWVISKWNNLSFPLPDILGGPIETPNIDYLARGGISGGLAMVGERGRELVKLPYGSTVINNSQTERMLQQSGGGEFTFKFTPTDTPILDAIIDGLQLYVKNRGGGNVQVALGRSR